MVFLIGGLWRDCNMVQDRGEKAEVDLPRDFSLTRPNQKGKISEARQSKAKSNKRRTGPVHRCGTFILRSTATPCNFLP
jgi:hypothetical protein